MTEQNQTQFEGGHLFGEDHEARLGPVSFDLDEADEAVVFELEDLALLVSVGQVDHNQGVERFNLANDGVVGSAVFIISTIIVLV